MASTANVNTIIDILSAILPGILGLIKAFWRKVNPNDPIPTDQEILAAFAAACARTIAVDDAWLEAHPPKPPA